MTASISDVQKAIDAAAKGSGYQCVPVSWEDAQRGTVGGALSCWGGNISDVRLWEKSGKLLYTCRSQNWNERLGYVAAKDVAVVVGNHEGASVRASTPPRAVSLRSYLQAFGAYARYAGVEREALFADAVDELLSIRFQTVFLPVAGDGGTAEFCTEVYNYNTSSDDDPRNVTLLCTAQGTSVQQDGRGAQRIFHHEVDAGGQTHRYWLEAEASRHKVGGQQEESSAEAAAAATRGKSAAIHIGTRAMGTRFNVQMLVQLPIKQRAAMPMRYCDALDDEDCYISCANDNEASCEAMCTPYPAPSPMRGVCAPLPTVGTSNAARVSRGSEHDVWSGVVHKLPERDPSMHGTITVTMYYTVVGGVPSAADVTAAVADLNALYSACASDKRLVDCSEVTTELTVKNMQDIKTKMATQPYAPPSVPPPNNSAGFPE